MNSQELLIKYKDFESRLIQVAAQVRGYEESRIFAEETEATRALLLAEIQEQYAAEETNPLAAATFRRAAASLRKQAAEHQFHIRNNAPAKFSAP